MRLVPVLAVLLGAAGPPPALDWPCMQRLVPKLAAGSLWAGHDGTADWRSDPRVADLVVQVAPRSRPAAEGVATLTAFAASLPVATRAATLDRVFTGLVEETNAERSQVIDRLHGMARRQRDLTTLLADVTAQMRALPPDAPAAERDEVTQRRAFLLRDYEGVGRTIRYACEVPVQLEARLGQFAQALQAMADN